MAHRPKGKMPKGAVLCPACRGHGTPASACHCNQCELIRNDPNMRHLRGCSVCSHRGYLL